MSTPDSRSIALTVLDEVRKSGTLAVDALRREIQRCDVDPRTSAAANRLALGVLRTRRVLDAALDAHASRTPPSKDKRLMDILRLAAYELFYMDSIPDYATVNRFVKLVRATKGNRVAGFANALLRRLAKMSPEDRQALEQSLSPAQYLSMPDWIAAELGKSFGPDWATVATTLNRRAPITLRVNNAKIDLDGLCASLAEAGLEPQPLEWLPGAVVLASSQPPYQTMAFAKGHFWPQDAGSQLVAAVTAAAGGPAFLDGCAGNGTKSFALANLVGADARVTALELLPGKVADLAKRSEQYGVSGLEWLAGDLAEPPLPPASFDTVLVDAPCTGLGTLRRHPELRWRRSLDDAVANSRLQRQLLSSAAELVRPGGRLVYCVCSFLLAEGPDVVRDFLEVRTDHRFCPPSSLAKGPLQAKLSDLEEAFDSGNGRPGLMTISPHVDGDLFFLSVLERRE